jgi:hypothetical protein
MNVLVGMYFGAFGPDAVVSHDGLLSFVLEVGGNPSFEKKNDGGERAAASCFVRTATSGNQVTFSVMLSLSGATIEDASLGLQVQPSWASRAGEALVSFHAVSTRDEPNKGQLCLPDRSFGAERSP